MPTECNPELFDFGSVEGRRVVAGFDGGRVTSDAGALLLGATDQAIGLIERFAACFSDGRSATDVEHSVATLAGKLAARRSRCAPLAGKSTLNRLEHGAAAA